MVDENSSTARSVWRKATPKLFYRKPKIKKPEVKMFLNFQLNEPPASKQSCFEPVLTTTRAEPAPGIHIAIEAEKGQIETVRSQPAKLKVSNTSDDLKWVELGVLLDEPGWVGCNRIHMKLRASAATRSPISPALRVLYEDGFRDLFPSTKCTIANRPTDIACAYDLSPRVMNKAQNLALHIFFETRENEYELHDLALTGIA